MAKTSMIERERRREKLVKLMQVVRRPTIHGGDHISAPEARSLGGSAECPIAITSSPWYGGNFHLCEPTPADGPSL